MTIKSPYLITNKPQWKRFLQRRQLGVKLVEVSKHFVRPCLPLKIFLQNKVTSNHMPFPEKATF